MIWLTRSATCIASNERVLITTLTVKMAEDLTDYLKKADFKVAYLHHETQTLESDRNDS